MLKKTLKALASTTVVAGLAFSALLFSFAGHAAEQGSEESVEAKTFAECAAIRMKEINLGHLAGNAEKNTTRVPEGWTVISGAGGEGHPKLLICR